MSLTGLRVAPEAGHDLPRRVSIGFEPVVRFAQRRPVGLRPARRVSESLTPPGGAAGPHPSGDALAVGRDPGMAIDHGGDSALEFRGGKASVFQASGFGAPPLGYAQPASPFSTRIDRLISSRR